MKIIACLAFLFVLFSCMPRKQVAPPAVKPPSKYRTLIACKENTKETFNRYGIDALPFIRTFFIDIDIDGQQELIAGSQDGLLRLYRREYSDYDFAWKLRKNYFAGIKAGAFSSPAAGDIDGDGNVEILIGTGGFSRNSGRVIFYRNSGTRSHPVWNKIDSDEINVGNDATPVLADVDKDGRPDLIIGNSEGKLFLFRNKSSHKKISFVKDASYFKGIDLGMYIVPTLTVIDGKIVLVAGNSMGKLYLLERSIRDNDNWSIRSLDISLSSFATPAFIHSLNPDREDLIISDGNGGLHYYKNTNNTFMDWEKSQELFSGRIYPGPACTPTITEIEGKTYMVTGNKNGEMKFFKYNPYSKGLPWREVPGYFRKIELSSFSKGIITRFQNKDLLITAQQDGVLKAFLNFGTIEYPLWTEQKRFFTDMPKITHASPAVFDINRDGKWEMIIGDAEGNVHGFHYRITEKGNIFWKKIENSFSHIKVAGYATPTFFRDDDRIFMFVGQQDGRIKTFIAESNGVRFPRFYRNGYINDIKVNNHSAPFAHIKDGALEIAVGDYNGNLKHFACRKERVKVQ